MKTTTVAAIVLVTVAAGLAGFATPAEAFCVYNDTDRPVRFHQHIGGIISGARAFDSQWLQPGKNACCNWREEGCNPSKHQKGLVKITVLVEMPSQGPLDLNAQRRCEEVQFEAGGYLKASRDGSHYITRVFNTDNSQRRQLECTQYREHKR